MRTVAPSSMFGITSIGAAGENELQSCLPGSELAMIAVAPQRPKWCLTLYTSWSGYDEPRSVITHGTPWTTRVATYDQISAGCSHEMTRSGRIRRSARMAKISAAGLAKSRTVVR